MREREEQERFEHQVRHVAACLWPSGGPGNPELHEGRERDAVFVTDDAIHIVEATASRKKQKVIDDCKKTLGLPPDAIHLFIGDFSEEQVRLYLEKLGQTVAVPDWLPSRPPVVRTSRHTWAPRRAE